MMNKKFIPTFNGRQQFMLKVECFIRREVPWDYQEDVFIMEELHKQMCNELHAGLKGLTYDEVFKSRILPSPSIHKIEMSHDVTYHNALHFFRQGIIWAKNNSGMDIVSGLLKNILNDNDFMKSQFNNVWERYRSG